MSKEEYSDERFTEFVNRVIDLLSHVKRIDTETGEIFEESWKDGEIYFEDYGFNNVENAITVDYEYDYDDDYDLDGCVDDDGQTLADVHGFKLHDGQLYIEFTFYAGHGTSTTSWDRLSNYFLKRPITLERTIIGTMDKFLAERWRWDLQAYLDAALSDTERGCSKIERTQAFSIPEGCILQLGEGIPLLNGKVATALKLFSYPEGLSICTKPVEELSLEDYPISPDDPAETLPDFIEKVIGLLENQQSKLNVIVPDKDVTLYWVIVWFKEYGVHFDTLTIKDKDTVINDGDLDSIHTVFRSLHVPHGFIIPENAGLDPSVEMIEDSE